LRCDIFCGEREGLWILVGWWLVIVGLEGGINGRLTSGRPA
jgi:hypothetical protein